MKFLIKRLVKRLMCSAGFTIRRINSADTVKDYIDPKSTIAAARARNMTAAEYCCHVLAWGTIDAWLVEMNHMKLFDRYRGSNVLEIGAGVGCFTHTVHPLLAAKSYENYEPSKGWSDYMAKTYGITSRPCDGRSLSSNAAQSVDLVFAHGVFVYIPFTVTAHYWAEAARVLRPGGTLIFDAMTEECMTPDNVAKWHAAEAHYPALIPHQTILDFFAARGLKLARTFLHPFGPATCKYFVFEASAVLPRPCLT
jgi:SAM-dependent methyltransferase